VQRNSNPCAGTVSCDEPGQRIADGIERDVTIYDFDFDVVVARVHARLRAEQRCRGRIIGTRDLIIAATAMSLGWGVLTSKRLNFGRSKDWV
jgi:predicted nucleic acid-binding protein